MNDDRIARLRALFEEVLQDYYNDASFIIDDRCWGDGRETAMKDLDETMTEYRQQLDVLLEELRPHTDVECIAQVAGRYFLD